MENATHYHSTGPTIFWMRSQLTWSCPECAEHMAKQEKSMGTFNKYNGLISFHCKNCIEAFHSVMSDIQSGFNVPLEDYLLWDNPYVCTGCLPATMMEGGVLYRDLDQIHENTSYKTLFRNYNYNPIGVKIESGYLQGEKLTNSEIQSIINDMRVDQGYRMDRILRIRQDFCICEHCVRFKNFHNLMKLTSLDYIQTLKNTPYDSEPLMQLNRCQMLWYYYLRFILPQQDTKTKRKNYRKALIVAKEENFLGKNSLHSKQTIFNEQKNQSKLSEQSTLGKVKFKNNTASIKLSSTINQP